MASLLGRLSRPLSRRTLALVAIVLALNLFDAFATLRHVEHGAEELNPLMALLLRQGPASFVGGKHALAVLGVAAIATCPQQRAAQLALAILVPLYALLAAYQLLLFAWT